MKIKICGITNLDDALIAEANGADAIGFIFYDKSARFIDFNSAAAIIDKLNPLTMKIGVFVNEDLNIVNKYSKQLKLSAVQLHGEETPDYVENVISPVIKAFRVGDNFDFNILNNYRQCSFLLDSFSEKSYGGTGLNFDWEVIPKNLSKHIILAGGISEENIEHILKKIKPGAIDISSSVEDKPGKKNKTKLINLLKIINEANN